MFLLSWHILKKYIKSPWHLDEVQHQYTTIGTSSVLFYNVSSYNYICMHPEQMSTATAAINTGFLF